MPQIVWRKILEVWETPGIEGYLDNEDGRFNPPLTMGLQERRGGGSIMQVLTFMGLNTSVIFLKKVFSLDIH